MKITAVAIATTTLVVLLGVGGYGLLKHQPTPTSTIQRPKAQATVAPAPSAQLPEAFRPYSGRGTPGEAVAYHLAKGTPQAGLDAYYMIQSCQLSRAAAGGVASPSVETACDGITHAMEQQAGELVAHAMVAGLQGAAVAFYSMLRHVPPDAFKELETNPSLRQGVDAMLEALKVAARQSQDRGAISALSVLYSGATPMVKRDPAAALSYVTALRELRPPLHPAFKESADRHMAELLAELTPEQAEAARAAGIQLARECNCKEG